MKSFKMKALSLAVLGLAGFGMTNAAFACDATNLVGVGRWSISIVWRRGYCCYPRA